MQFEKDVWTMPVSEIENRKSALTEKFRADSNITEGAVLEMLTSEVSGDSMDILLKISSDKGMSFSNKRISDFLLKSNPNRVPVRMLTMAFIKESSVESLVAFLDQHLNSKEDSRRKLTYANLVRHSRKEFRVSMLRDESRAILAGIEARKLKR